MRIQRLSVNGASILVPDLHQDVRGQFVTTFSTDPGFDALRFPVAQVSHGRSHRGVTRGIHFTSTPPGCAKLVWCSAGRAVDFVVDLRVGSPTFGHVDRVQLDPGTATIVSLPVGVGHAYQATENDTVITYLLSTGYVADNEQALAVSDPDLGFELPLPGVGLMSPRDLAAPTLREWQAGGGLPEYSASVQLDQDLRARAR